MRAKSFVTIIFSLLITGLKAQEMEWVKIDSGRFDMGGHRDDSEKPAHKVIVGGFYISKSEVTVDQYRRYCTATGLAFPKQPAWSKGGNWPVVNVSWKEAVAYADWAVARLPTEAEWEYAARGGGKEKTDYSGSNQLSKVAWYVADQPEGARQVMTKEPNKAGIFDMTGNVQEWCSDWYSSNYYHVSPPADPKGPANGFHRVVRGSGWFNQPKSLYLSRRFSIGPNYRYDDLGFRLVKEIDSTANRK